MINLKEKILEIKQIADSIDETNAQDVNLRILDIMDLCDNILNAENKDEIWLSEKEIIQNIRDKGKFYEENIFCVENVVRHTIKYLADKNFIDVKIEKKKIKRDKTKKVGVF